MSSFEKDKEEKLFLNYFTEIFYAFPKGKLIKTESPDFIIKKNHKKSIGIELTRLFSPKTGKKGHSYKKENNHEIEIINLTREIYQSEYPYKLYVTFNFSSDRRIDRDLIPTLARKISEIINQKIQHENYSSFFQYIIEDPILPDIIESIHVIYHPQVRFASWRSIESWLKPGQYREIVENAIREKEDKLRIYQKKRIDQFWLILITDLIDRSTALNLDNQISKWSVRSKFHKVFLFELFYSQIFELK